MNYYIIDSARSLEQTEFALKLNANSVCLYRGQSEKNLAIVAPYLLTCENNSEFLDWIFKSGWGKSWGFFVVSDANPFEIYQHFRKFLIIQIEDSKKVYFRFYDPRVLRVFLPTCDEHQLKEFFGPVSHFTLENEDPSQALVFSLRNGALHTEVIPALAPMGLKTQPSE